MSKEQALRILKLLSGLEVIVFQKSEGVPDHTIDELIKIVDELTDYVLGEKESNGTIKRTTA